MRIKHMVLGTLVLGLVNAVSAEAKTSYRDASKQYILQLEPLKGTFVKGYFIGNGKRWRIDAEKVNGQIEGVLIVRENPYQEVSFRLLDHGKNRVLKFWQTDSNQNMIPRTLKSVVLYPNQKQIKPSLKQSRGIYVNGKSLSLYQIQGLEKKYNIKMKRGSFWYDAKSGLWGLKGGPALGVILPRLKLGGKLKPYASNGRTGVFVNGRQLHAFDVTQLRALLGTVYKGRYWLDAKGNVGRAGKRRVLVNLHQILKQRKGVSSFYRNRYTGIGSGSSGGSGYVMGKNWSVSW